MQFNEALKIKKFMKAFEADIPNLVTIMGTEAQNFFTKNFAKQGFDDAVVEKWKPRRSTRDAGRAILVGKGSGVLRKSIRFKKFGRNSALIYLSGPAAKYGNVHNEGLRAGRGKGFIMPKRQIVGDSKNLERIIERKLIKRIDTLFSK